jgi:hypothetical protein
MNKIRALIREMIKQELEEVTASGATPGYMTPKAFTGGSEKGESMRKKLAQVSGYTLSDKNIDEVDSAINESRSRYADYKSDSSTSPRQKIGKAVRQLNTTLDEMDSVLAMNSRLKTESNMESSQLWKRTANQLVKMENKLGSIANRIRELKA